MSDDNDLSFMERLTSEHKNPQRVSETVPVTSLNSDEPTTTLATIVVTADTCGYGCGIYRHTNFTCGV